MAVLSPIFSALLLQIVVRTVTALASRRSVSQPESGKGEVDGERATGGRRRVSSVYGESHVATQLRHSQSVGQPVSHGGRSVSQSRRSVTSLSHPESGKGEVERSVDGRAAACKQRVCDTHSHGGQSVTAVRQR